MGCTFCATGTMGLKGNLSAGEIVEQLVHASQVAPIRNIVFMVRHPSSIYRGYGLRLDVICTSRCGEFDRFVYYLLDFLVKLGR